MNGFTEVASGVFIADGPLPDLTVVDVDRIPNLAPPVDVMREVEASGRFITATDFGRAGIDAGKTANYGQGVMRDIAAGMVGIEAEEAYTVNGNGRYLLSGTASRDLHDRVTTIMNHPDFVKRGSRHRLLLESDLVYEVWRAGDGYPPEEFDVPTFAKVGQRIVSMVMLFQPDFVEARRASDPSDSS